MTIEDVARLYEKCWGWREIATLWYEKPAISLTAKEISKLKKLFYAYRDKQEAQTYRLLHPIVEEEEAEGKDGNELRICRSRLARWAAENPLSEDELELVCEKIAKAFFGGSEDYGVRKVKMVNFTR